LDEHGNLVKIRKSLRTNGQETAAQELLNFRANVEGLNIVIARAKPTVEEAMAQYFKEEAGRGVFSETLKSLPQIS
jgi:hypothetical protein